MDKFKVSPKKNCSSGKASLDDEYQHSEMSFEVQDEGKNRNLREEYRKIHIGLEEKAKNNDTPGCDYIGDYLKQTDKLYPEVSKPREAIYDSKVLITSVNIIKQRTQQVNTGLIEFKAEQFARQFGSFFNSVKFGTPKKRSYADMLIKYGNLSKNILHTTPALYPMYNAFDKTDSQVPKKIRQVRAKQEISKVVEKAMTVDSSENNEQEASENIERILNILHKIYSKNSEPVCYFSFVLNPDSFAETIENMFYLSVLAKEGAVEIGMDADKLPYIEPIEPGKRHGVKLHGVYSQSIISLDRNDWQKLVEAFDIKRATITRKKQPTRTPANDGP